MNEQSNIYLPHLMVIEKITHEAPGVKTFRLKFKDEKEGEAFHFKAGRGVNFLYCFVAYS